MRTLKRFAIAVSFLPLFAACATFTPPANLGGHDIADFKKVLTMDICPDNQNGINAELRTKDEEVIIFIKFKEETFAVLAGNDGRPEKFFVKKDGNWQEASEEKIGQTLENAMKTGSSCINDTFKRNFRLF